MPLLIGRVLQAAAILGGGRQPGNVKETGLIMSPTSNIIVLFGLVVDIKKIFVQFMDSTYQ